ncbi:heme exporter protein CcmD [Sphingomicrobium nitratireducens]|nr:heme exporter protein CcmD [Sphingomicrobium nitratireducens]
MNHWAFVIAAYGLTLGATALLLGLSAVAMRRAEADAEAVTRR